jgi:hypothetical protein
MCRPRGSHFTTCSHTIPLRSVTGETKLRTCAAKDQDVFACLSDEARGPILRVRDDFCPRCHSDSRWELTQEEAAREAELNEKTRRLQRAHYKARGGRKYGEFSFESFVREEEAMEAGEKAEAIRKGEVVEGEEGERKHVGMVRRKKKAMPKYDWRQYYDGQDDGLAGSGEGSADSGYVLDSAYAEIRDHRNRHFPGGVRDSMFTNASYYTAPSHQSASPAPSAQCSQSSHYSLGIPELMLQPWRSPRGDTDVPAGSNVTYNGPRRGVTYGRAPSAHSYQGSLHDAEDSDEALLTSSESGTRHRTPSEQSPRYSPIIPAGVDLGVLSAGEGSTTNSYRYSYGVPSGVDLGSLFAPGGETAAAIPYEQLYAANNKRLPTAPHQTAGPLRSETRIILISIPGTPFSDEDTHYSNLVHSTASYHAVLLRYPFSPLALSVIRAVRSEAPRQSIAWNVAAQVTLIDGWLGLSLAQQITNLETVVPNAMARHGIPFEVQSLDTSRRMLQRVAEAEARAAANIGPFAMPGPQGAARRLLSLRITRTRRCNRRAQSAGPYSGASSSEQSRTRTSWHSTRI